MMITNECAEYEKNRLMGLVFNLHVLTEKDIKKAKRNYKITDFGRHLKDEHGNILKVGDLAVLLSVIERRSGKTKGFDDCWVSRHQVSKWLNKSEIELGNHKSYCIESGRELYGTIREFEYDIEIMQAVLEQFDTFETNKDLEETLDMPMGL